MMRTYIPENLNLPEVLSTKPPAFKYHIDEFYFLLGTLAKLKAQNKDWHEQEFTPMSATIMQKRVRGYKQIMEYLVGNGILESDKHYIVGEKSFSYKFSSAYTSNGIKTVTITLNKLTKVKPAEQKKLDDFYAEYGYLTKWFNPLLRIDYDKAYGWIMNAAFEDVKAEVPEAMAIADARELGVKMINDGVYNLSVDDNIQRFHSILTNLKKELRMFLTYGDAPLTAIDISNSQPFFSMVFFDQNFYRKDKDTFTLYSLSEEIYERIEPIIPSILSTLSDLPFFMLVKSDVQEATNDLELYCTLVDKGTIYQYLSRMYRQKTGISYNVKVPAEKEKLKKAVFYTMYSGNRNFGSMTDLGKIHGDMKRLFVELFPTVYKIFSLLKKAKHNDLAKILQLIESGIVVRRTARALSESHPDLPLFTIHDSIATLTEQKDIVYMELKKQCFHMLRLRPTLKHEDWK